jgi:ABC-type nitrate/sulfonate/bicarbonate transport system permease component
MWARDRRGDEDRVPVSRSRGVFDPHGQGRHRRGPEHLLDQRPRPGRDPWEAIRHAVLPIAMPRIADDIIVSIAVMWTYITVAEYVNAKVGLGQLIQNARRFSAIDQVFVGIFVIIALALVTYAVMTAIKRRLYPWETA